MEQKPKKSGIYEIKVRFFRGVIREDGESIHILGLPLEEYRPPCGECEYLFWIGDWLGLLWSYEISSIITCWWWMGPCEKDGTLGGLLGYELPLKVFARWGLAGCPGGE